MSSIKKAFENGKAFIAFITCGDPDLETTAVAVKAAVENGADLIELGIPFSDPTAEGPVIQGANIRALSGGVTTDKIFAFVRELRRDVKVPMVFMTYANVLFSYGAEKFISTCRDIEIDGLILPDRCRSGIADCTHIRKPHCNDCKRSRRLSLYCFKPGRYGNKE